MNLAWVSSNGQITVPVEIQRLLKLKEGDKLLFAQNENGDVIIENASANAIRKAQKAFEGAAKDFGFENEDDVDNYINELRYAKRENA
jgi:AbrB family looped-hinge helix DNA binding protein